MSFVERRKAINRTLLNTLQARTVDHLHRSHLSLCRHPFSRCILSSSCARNAEAILEFHSHLSPLAVLFGLRDPGLQTLPYLLSFLLHQLVPGFQSFPGCPGLLWLRHVHHSQVPQGNPACHAYRGCHLLLAVHRNTLRSVLEEWIITVSSVRMQAIIRVRVREFSWKTSKAMMFSSDSIISFILVFLLSLLKSQIIGEATHFVITCFAADIIGGHRSQGYQHKIQYKQHDQRALYARFYICLGLACRDKC